MNRKIKMAALVLAVVAGTVGYAAAQDCRYYDRDDNRYSDRDDNRYSDRDDYRYQDRYHDRDDGRYDNSRRGIHAARAFGFRDGAEVARGDMLRGKPFNPNPRGRFDDADHGYNRAFGNKHEYREHYTEAYREGYQSTFRGGYYR